MATVFTITLISAVPAMGTVSFPPMGPMSSLDEEGNATFDTNIGTS